MVDRSGYAARNMREVLGRGRAFSQLLADMEADGMIEREVRGRRTYSVRLLDGWGLDDDMPAVDQPDAPSTDGVDLDMLAEALLAIVVKRATAPPPDRSAETKLAEVMASVERERDSRIEAEAKAHDLAEQVRRLEHNIGVLRAELDRPRKGGTGSTLRDRLADDDRAMLDRLLRELPATAESRRAGKKESARR